MKWRFVLVGFFWSLAAFSNGCGGATESDGSGSGSGVGGEMGSAAGHGSGGAPRPENSAQGGGGGGGGAQGKTIGGRADQRGGSAAHQGASTEYRDGGAGNKDGVADAGMEAHHSDGDAGSSGIIVSDGGDVGIDASLADAPSDVPSDGPWSFGDVIEFAVGTWLIGWSGGQNHFSWLRLERDSTWTATVLDGHDIPHNAPYWNCSGQGTWMPTEIANTVLVRLPDSCVDAAGAYFTFERFSTPSTTIVSGATLQATIQSRAVRETQPLVGFKFPDTQCDATLTSCTNPF